MKLRSRLLVLAAVAILICITSAAYSATQTIGANAIIKQAISISKVTGQDLLFGCLRPDLVDSAIVTIDPFIGDRYISGPILISGSGDTYQPAQFTITGDPFAWFFVSLPGTVQLTSGLNSLQVTNFRADEWLNPLDPDGTRTLRVGADLGIPADCPPGSYTGSFDVTVTYE